MAKKVKATKSPDLSRAFTPSLAPSQEKDNDVWV